MSDGKFRGPTPYTTPADVNPGYDALMHEVCVGYGYCGSVQDGKPVHVGDFIPKDGAVTADQFVEWIFQAEDLDLAGGSASYKNAIREAFVRQMSADVVDAQMLHWNE